MVSSSLYFGRAGLAGGRSAMGMEERWKRPVGKYCGKSIRSLEDSLRLKGRRLIVSEIMSRKRLEAMLESWGTV